MRKTNIDCHVILTNQDVAMISRNQYILIKPHGDINGNEEDLVITKNDYYLSFEKKDIIWNKIINTFIERSVIFLGYSMRDPDFSYIQAILYNKLKDNYRKSYALMFDVDEVIIEDLKSRNISVIDLGSSGDEKANEKIYSVFQLLYDRSRQFIDVYDMIPTMHKKRKASEIVPKYIINKLIDNNYQLIRCYEILTSQGSVESGDPYTIPLEAMINIPAKYFSSSYKRFYYERYDSIENETFKGVAIGKI